LVFSIKEVFYYGFDPEKCRLSNLLNYNFAGMKWFAFIILLVLFVGSCSEPKRKLPILGNPDIVGQDTIYPRIRNFSFIDQDSAVVSNKTFENKIYVTDFIFLSCPTICPAMTTEMKKVYMAFHINPNIMFLSHTIDPERDSIPVLKRYTNALGIDSQKWRFVTGKKEEIYDLAEKNYYNTAYADSIAPGGFIHGGGLLLIDKNRHIRGVYDGTNPKETERLLNDMETLLNEQFK
jgi:protein SCO1/2